LGMSASHSMQFGKTTATEKEGEICRLCSETFIGQSIGERCHMRTACQHPFNNAHWNAQIISNHKRFKRRLVCADFSAGGSTVNNFEKYKCTDCSMEWGSLKFNTDDLKNKKRGPGGDLRRTDCKSKIKCEACKVAYNKSEWSAKERNKFQQKQITLVCKACRHKGCTPKDSSLYICQTCNKTFGTKQNHLRQQ